MPTPTRVPMKPLKRGDAVVSKYTGAKGKVSGTSPFTVKYGYKGRVYNRFTNPNFWKRG
jgi:hypothetical protein